MKNIELLKSIALKAEIAYRKIPDTFNAQEIKRDQWDKELDWAIVDKLNTRADLFDAGGKCIRYEENNGTLEIAVEFPEGIRATPSKHNSCFSRINYDRPRPNGATTTLIQY